MDSGVLVVGDTHNLSLNLENKCKNTELITIRVKLVGFFVYRAVDRSSSAMVDGVDFLLKENLPVRPGEGRSFKVNVNVPLDVFPSLPTDLAPLITVHWYVRISCTYKSDGAGASATFSADIPVLLSMPLPPPLGSIVHPPMYPSVQPEIRSMIEYGAGVPHFPKSTAMDVFLLQRLWSHFRVRVDMMSSFASIDSLLKQTATGAALQLQASATASNTPPMVPSTIYDAPLSLPQLDTIASNAQKRYTISPDSTGALDATDLRAPPPVSSFFFGTNDLPGNYPRGAEPPREPPSCYAMFSDDHTPPRAPDDPSIVASSSAPTNTIHLSTT